MKKHYTVLAENGRYTEQLGFSSPGYCVIRTFPKLKKALKCVEEMSGEKVTERYGSVDFRNWLGEIAVQFNGEGVKYPYTRYTIAVA